MNESLISQQLKNVEVADLSNFDKDANTFKIPKRVDIKVDVDNCYLIKINESAFRNSIVINNWNNGNMIQANYLKVDVNKKMNKMIKVNGIIFDVNTNQDTTQFWCGWLCLDDLQIIKKL